MTASDPPDPSAPGTSGERSELAPDTAGGMSSERSESARSRPTSAAKAAPTAPPPSVLVFFDYACVFCYVDSFRFAQLSEEYGADITLVPFELRPDIPDEGISAEEYGLAHGERVEQYLEGVARRGHFPLVVPDHIPKTHDALVLGELARDAGPGTQVAVHAAILDARFGRGCDIGDREVLLLIAAAAGLDTAEVERAWDDGVYEQRLAEFHELGRRVGVNATPSALVCDELLIGTRPYGQLADSVERCLARQAAAAAKADGRG